MKSLPIAAQTRLEESEREFEEILGMLELDRVQLEQKVKRINSNASTQTRVFGKTSVNRGLNHV